jgi:hypothetical protein
VTNEQAAWADILGRTEKAGLLPDQEPTEQEILENTVILHAMQEIEATILKAEIAIGMLRACAAWYPAEAK